MAYVDYKCLESLLIEGEELQIANEGFLDKLKQLGKSSKLPEGMSEIAALHKYIDDKKIYNKSEEQTTDNAYGGQLHQQIAEDYRHDAGAAMVGMKILIHQYNSQNTKFPTFIAITLMNDKPDSFIIPFAKRSDIKFTWKDVVRNANQH